MQIYLVGGAVRDQLLGRPVKEKDWVVVGTTPEQMLAQGFRPVGKDFPVFLHPITNEEYALARTERKIGPGYKGFMFYAAPEVTLENDLLRRDLTINAIAQTETGEIIDPFHGCDDLKNKLLRHVSPAFAEDPVRILRVARFAARFGDFKINAETMQLMQTMVKKGEVNALVAERVWKELAIALAEPHPERFFMVLADVGASEILFPNFNFTSEAKTALKTATAATQSIAVRFAAAFHQLDLMSAKELCKRYRIPNDITDILLLAIQYLYQYQQALNCNAEQLLSLLEKIDAFRRPQRFKQFLLVGEACSLSSNPKEITSYLFNIYKTASSINTTELVQQGLTGQQIKQALHTARLESITHISKK